VLIALALGNTTVLAATLAVGALAGLLALRAAVQTPERSSAAGVAGAPRAQRAVLSANGAARQALIVQAAAVDGYQTVLTIDGYALINAEGRVVYAINREGPAEMNEPVVVTILDAEAADQPDTVGII